jgi:DNA-binding CsgD family transcriptional regulator
VAPQLRGAVSLAERFALAKGQSSIETLERVGYAALVLDNNGQMVLINASAESMLGGDLTLSADRLHARDHESDRRLQTLIDRAVAPRALEAQVPSPEFVRRFEGRPFMVEAMPASGALRDVFRRIAALVVITDLNARPRAPDCLIREAFGLTAAEARLAATLASGEDLRKAAERLGVTRETARGHLKSIFSKTEVNRQSELTALIARLGKKSP